MTDTCNIKDPSDKIADLTGCENWQVPEHQVREFAGKVHSVALVIPVINEGERIRCQLRNFAELDLAVDLVIADGGSTDGSLDEDILIEVGASALLTKTGPGRLSAQLRMAYAWCLRRGYDGIVTMDGNGKDNVSHVTRVLDALNSGADYVQGSRYADGGVARNTPLDRAIANRLVHAPLLSLAGRKWLTDTTNGFRGYSRRYLADPRVSTFRDTFMNYELLFYLTVRAGQLGYEVVEVPVERNYPGSGKTPTRITGLKSRLLVLAQTVRAATGRFNPR